MKYYIEEAIIVEVHEVEPHFKVETVVPEVIKSSRKKRQRKGLFESLFDLFLDPFNFLDDYEEELIDPEPIYQEKVKNPKPEIALITDSDESRIKEYRYFYYEINE